MNKDKMETNKILQNWMNEEKKKTFRKEALKIKKKISWENMSKDENK